MKTIVKAVCVVEGIHCWGNCHIEEVDYLKYPHRHQFNIIARVKVKGLDREVEFIQLSHKIKKYLHSQYWSTNHQCCYFGSKSCEMIATELLLHFNLDFCEVDEDNEGGAIVYK